MLVGSADSVTRVGDVDAVICAVVTGGEEVKAKPTTLRNSRWVNILLVNREPDGTDCAPGGSVCHDSGLPSNVEAWNINAVCIGGLIPDTLDRKFS